MNDEEFIVFIKFGKSNIYEKILNNNLKLNLSMWIIKLKKFHLKIGLKIYKTEKTLKNKQKLKEEYKIFLNIK